MTTPQPLRFTCSIRDLTVTDTRTGIVVKCTSVEHMALTRRTLEIQNMPAKTGRRTKR